MISHTGYLVFARPVILDLSQSNPELLEEIGLLENEKYHSKPEIEVSGL
jgi:hypothetical protein